jgi:tRNA U34 5-methylaminomethyl-2-thiouridine-forming methyltransferase MnmC
MERIIQLTADGSHTIAIPELNVTCHSKHGSFKESLHVFINAGLKYKIENCNYLNFSANNPLKIFEMGFGTGLNCLLTYINSSIPNTYYYALEKYPINPILTKELNYNSFLEHNILNETFNLLHQSPWNIDTKISSHLTLHKSTEDITNFKTKNKFHLIYYDAFAPRAQPNLWTTEIFENLYSLLEENGIIVTYCSKGDVRRAMIKAGEKIPGPPGKREMLQAMKAKKV